MVIHSAPAPRDRVVDVACAPYALRLSQPWRTARGERARREGWIIRLRTADGRAGYGECAPLPEAGTESLEQARAGLSAMLQACLGHGWSGFQAVSCRWEVTPAARCAVETALLDLHSQCAGIPLALYLNPDADGVVAVNAALGGIGPGLTEKVAASLDQGFRVLKLKLGTAPVDEERAAVIALCQELPKGTRLRLDANGAWEPEQARQILQSLRHLPLDAVEEPLTRPDPHVLHWLQTGLPWPIALDETLSNERWRLPDDGFPCRRIVIKAPVLGGLAKSLDLAAEACGEGVEVVVTTLVDAAVGRLAALHLAAALDLPAVHGLDTGGWLQTDVGLAPSPIRGAMAVPDVPGLGFVPDPGLNFIPLPTGTVASCRIPLP